MARARGGPPLRRPTPPAQGHPLCPQREVPPPPRGCKGKAAAALRWPPYLMRRCRRLWFGPLGGVLKGMEGGGVEGPLQGQRRKLPQGSTEQGCVTCHVARACVCPCVRILGRRHAARALRRCCVPNPTSTPTLTPQNPDLAGTQFLVFEYMKRRIVAGAFFFAAAGTPLNARRHGFTPPSSHPAPAPGRAGAWALGVHGGASDTGCVSRQAFTSLHCASFLPRKTAAPSRREEL